MNGVELNSIPTEREQEISRREPHPRDAHLRIPNEVTEQLARLRLSGSEWQIVWVVLRRTVGRQTSGEWRNRHYPTSLGDHTMGYPSLILYSQDSGLSKTHLAVGIVNKGMDCYNGDPDRSSCPVRVGNGSGLIRRIRATYSISIDGDHGREEDIYNRLRWVKLLILIDCDFGYCARSGASGPALSLAETMVHPGSNANMLGLHSRSPPLGCSALLLYI
jgi:hypothetical protein